MCMERGSLRREDGSRSREAERGNLGRGGGGPRTFSQMEVEEDPEFIEAFDDYSVGRIPEQCELAMQEMNTPNLLYNDQEPKNTL